MLTPKKKFLVEIDESRILNACLELVTINGRPFKLMDDSGFKKILIPLLDGIGNSIAINAENIREKVSNLANITRDSIRQEVRGRLLSLKVDCCTRLDK